MLFTKERISYIPSEDPSRSTNGGCYSFWTDRFTSADKKITFDLQGTSAEFDYCQIDGHFTNTKVVPLVYKDEPVEVDGEQLYAEVSEYILSGDREYDVFYCKE